jgi:hypothetical protein
MWRIFLSSTVKHTLRKLPRTRDPPTFQIRKVSPVSDCGDLRTLGFNTRLGAPSNVTHFKEVFDRRVNGCLPSIDKERICVWIEAGVLEEVLEV